MSILKSIKTKATEIKNKADDWAVENEDMVLYALGIVVGASAGAAIMGLHKDLKFAGILDTLNKDFIRMSTMDIYPMLNKSTMQAGIAVKGEDIFGNAVTELIECSDPNQVTKFADQLTEYAVRAGATVDKVPEATNTQAEVTKELAEIAAKLMELNNSNVKVMTF